MGRFLSTKILFLIFTSQVSFLGYGLADTDIIAPLYLKLDKSLAFKKLLGDKLVLEQDIQQDIDSVDQQSNMDQLDLKKIRLQSKIKLKLQDKGIVENKLSSAAAIESLSIEIAELNYNLDFERMLEGNLVRFKMDIQCYDIKLTSDQLNYGYLLADLDLSAGFPKVDINELILLKDFKLKDFSVASCRGAKNSEAELKKIVKERLSNTKSLTKLILPFLQKAMDRKLKTLVEDFKKPKFIAKKDDLNLFYQFRSVTDCKQSFCVSGSSLASIQSGVNTVVNLLEASPSSDSSFPALKEAELGRLMFSKQWLQAIVTNGSDARFMNLQTDTNSHKPLRKLMSSRFRQGYVWRDLKSFPKGTNLYLNSYAPMPPHIGEISNDDQGALTIDFHAVVKTDVLAPKEKEYQHYAYLNSNLVSKVVVSLTENEVIMTNSLQTMTSSHEFDPVYMSKYAPDPKIKEKTINKALNSLFENLQLVKFSRELEVFDGVELSIESIHSENSKDIELVLK